MQMIMYIAAILAFAPTLLLMYAILRKYTYPAVQQPFFSDPAFFGLFAVGLVAGTLLIAVYTWLNWSNILYASMFAVIQCLAMVMVLNLKRFHGKSDSVFYGYGLGLGMGCTMAFGMIFYLGGAVMTVGNLGIAEYAWLFVIGLSDILIISAVGTTIGEGIARLRPMEFALQAIFVNVAFAMVMAFTYSFLIGSNPNEVLFYIGLVAALLIAGAYFYRTMHIKLSGVVRDVLRMEGKNRKDVPK